MKKKIENIRILFVSILMVISILSFFVGKITSFYIDTIIWAIYVFDILYNWVRSKDKSHYVKEHWLDFLAAIPYFAFIRSFKLIPVIFLLIRYTKLGKRYFTPVYKFLYSSQWGKLILIIFNIFILLPLPLIWIEPQMPTYREALWWAIETVTTVGYGDIVPVTTLGRVIGVIIMLLGIGTVTTLTGWLTRNILYTKKLDLSQIKKHVDTMTEKELSELEDHIHEVKKTIKTDVDKSEEKHKEKKEKIEEERKEKKEEKEKEREEKKENPS